jgi:hypothetical protein
MGRIVIRGAAQRLARPQVHQRDPILGRRDHTGDTPVQHTDATLDPIRGGQQIPCGTAHRNDHEGPHFQRLASSPDRLMGGGTPGAPAAPAGNGGTCGGQCRLPEPADEDQKRRLS